MELIVMGALMGGWAYIKRIVALGEGDEIIVPKSTLVGAIKGLELWLYTRSGNTTDDNINVFNNILQLFIRLSVTFQNSELIRICFYFTRGWLRLKDAGLPRCISCRLQARILRAKLQIGQLSS